MKLKRRLYLIIAAAILFVAGFFTPSVHYLRLSIFLISYLLVGLPILRKAFRNIVRGQVFDENFLMAVATLGAWGLGEYSEAVAVMLFYQIGELFQSYAVNRSRRSIAALMDIRPDYANLKEGDGIRKVSPEEVAAGDFIIVNPGERIPLDGIIAEGITSLDTSALTGESLPRSAEPGSTVLSGSINLSSRITVRVTARYEMSTVAKILDLVENAGSKKAPLENFITRFARWYTPAVVILAAIIAFLPPFLASGETFRDWFYRALTFLVLSCPCALVISVPLGFFGGIGAASRNGILVKGSNYLEALSRAETIVFDKTGTLTRGRFAVQEICPVEISPDKLLELAAYAGSGSTHPVSLSVRTAYGKQIDSSRLGAMEELAGRGLKTGVDGQTVSLGNYRLMQENGINIKPCQDSGTVAYVAVDGRYAGYIRIADEIKPDAVAAIEDLRRYGVKTTVMLTGDTAAVGKRVAQELRLDQVFAELLPEHKVEKIEQLLVEKTPSERLVYVGDGINDAPVLARADIGIAMGGVGSDAAVEAADIVIMNDELSKISAAIAIARHTLGIVKQNIVFALGVKLVVLLLGLIGMATMWDAVFADVGVSVLAILNSLRALSYRVK